MPAVAAAWWVAFGTAVPLWSSFLADARHLTTRQVSGGDRYLNFHGNRDNLRGRATRFSSLVAAPGHGV
jgi:hypothetical protein